MGLLNLLTIYQKKHLVEFLPYHECDAPSRQAPDLDCLIKLQAHHTQQRHLIFLTGIIIITTFICAFIAIVVFLLSNASKNWQLSIKNESRICMSLKCVFLNASKLNEPYCHFKFDIVEIRI